MQTVTKGSGPATNVAYDAKNRVISPAFGYDANGNVTAIPKQGTLAYDVENRLRRLSFGSGVGTVQYFYGRNNERVWAGATGSAHDSDMMALLRYFGSEYENLHACAGVCSLQRLYCAARRYRSNRLCRSIENSCLSTACEASTSYWNGSCHCCTRQ
jgi:hypothetical protein